MGDVWLGVSGGSTIAAGLLFSLILRLLARTGKSAECREGVYESRLKSIK